MKLKLEAIHISGKDYTFYGEQKIEPEACEEVIEAVQSFIKETFRENDDGELTLDGKVFKMKDWSMIDVSVVDA